MAIPRLTAECGIGPAMHNYGIPPSPAAAMSGHGSAVTQMGFFDTLGSVFSGVADKIPCLIGCGLPNALSLVATCGIDPVCWVEHAPAAVGGCIRQCLQ